MLTHKKRKLFRNITLFALALSLVQTCWAGFLSEQKDELFAQDVIQNQEVQNNQNELLSMNTDTNASSNIALKQMINESKNSSLLDLNSPEAKSTVSKVKLDGSVAITNSPKKITLSLRDSDVRQVLRMFADKAGLNVVFHNSVEGTVTLDLNNVTLNDAFLLVLRSSELTYVKDGKNLIISSIEASKDLGLNKQSLTVIPVKYVEAPSIAKFLNANIFTSKMSGISNKQVVASNPRTNELMVLGSDADAALVQNIVQQIDKKPMLNVFKVNHTTPKEMAALLCDTLIPSQDALNSPGQTAQSTQSQIDDGDTKSNAESDDIKAIKLGGGFVACRSAIADSSGSAIGAASTDGNTITSLPVTSLTVTFSPDLGIVTVYGGSVQQIEMIKEFIAKNDIKQPMAYIELAVIELNESGSKEFDNQWAMWTPFLSLGFSSGNGLSTAPNTPVIFGPNPATGGAKYNGSSLLTYTLKYLVNNSKGRVLTNPKLMVANGQKALIDLTSDYIKSTDSQMSESVSSETPVVTTTYGIGNDEGLKIEMIPFISQDGYVSLNIVPNFATLKETVYAQNQANQRIIAATLMQRRNLKLSNLRIKDGETLVIAGLIKEDQKQNVTKVPVLGDLPLLGVFFRSSNNTLVKEELVIMITPHIVYSEDQIKDIKTMDL